MALKLTNHFGYQLGTKKIDLTTDTIVVILMATGWTFDQDLGTYAEVSASELAAGNGYTQKTETVTSFSDTEDDVNDRARFVFNDAVWSASGGAIGPCAGYLLIDDTTADDTVIGGVEFASDQTVSDGNDLTISKPTVDLTPQNT